jgi:hypothetical protein
MARRTVLTLILMTFSFGPGVTGAVVAGGPAATIAGTVEEEAMARWALGRFRDAGLELPALTIGFSDRDQAPCGGSPGRTYFEDVPRVMVCWDDEFILLHELAHVWVEANVTPADRAAFTALRDGVTAWAGSGIPWSELGAEHAANVVAWGLMETPGAISRTYPNDPDSMTVAFEVLTGTGPLHDGGPRYAPPDPARFADLPTIPLGSGR